MNKKEADKLIGKEIRKAKKYLELEKAKKSEIIKDIENVKQKIDELDGKFNVIIIYEGETEYVSLLSGYLDFFVNAALHLKEKSNELLKNN